jgi:hypothetical protein
MLSSLAAVEKVDKETQPGAFYLEMLMRAQVLFLNRTPEEATLQADVMIKTLREGKEKWILKGPRFSKDAEAFGTILEGWAGTILQGMSRTSFASQNIPLGQLNESVEYRIGNALSCVILAARCEGAMKYLWRGVSACVIEFAYGVINGVVVSQIALSIFGLVSLSYLSPAKLFAEAGSLSLGEDLSEVEAWVDGYDHSYTDIAKQAWGWSDFQEWHVAGALFTYLGADIPRLCSTNAKWEEGWARFKAKSGSDYRFLSSIIVGVAPCFHEPARLQRVLLAVGVIPTQAEYPFLDDKMHWTMDEGDGAVFFAAPETTATYVRCVVAARLPHLVQPGEVESWLGPVDRLQLDLMFQILFLSEGISTLASVIAQQLGDWREAASHDRALLAWNKNPVKQQHSLQRLGILHSSSSHA